MEKAIKVMFITAYLFLLAFPLIVKAVRVHGLNKYGPTQTEPGQFSAKYGPWVRGTNEPGINWPGEPGDDETEPFNPSEPKESNKGQEPKGPGHLFGQSLLSQPNFFGPGGFGPGSGGPWGSGFKGWPWFGGNPPLGRNWIPWLWNFIRWSSEIPSATERRVSDPAKVKQPVEETPTNGIGGDKQYP